WMEAIWVSLCGIENVAVVVTVNVPTLDQTRLLDPVLVHHGEQLLGGYSKLRPFGNGKIGSERLRRICFPVITDEMRVRVEQQVRHASTVLSQLPDEPFDTSNLGPSAAPHASAYSTAPFSLLRSVSPGWHFLDLAPAYLQVGAMGPLACQGG